eukprot:CAMPEP_0201596048 /NCGR_PEP_ID=MMETSP0190_2-20130828/192859_1 /ASSEMBLY_ACC=CAM_ASM_000263 /TAXON_ID=37353 /ORGANISM="Rosalina sp." /LENGTH=1129 /DNA_ID=CAMNT_0048056257 /DNA_START=38 /DNA_END=3427 /DNA_ORIENTATION=-
MSVDTEQTSNESMDVENGDNNDNNTQSIESNGNHNIDNNDSNNNNNDIELSSPSSTQSTQSTQKNKLIDKSTTIANGHDDKNLEEDIDDNIVLKKPMNVDSPQSSSTPTQSSPSNEDTETKENDNDNDNNNNNSLSSYPSNTKIRKIRKIGVSENGKLMPGFEVVNDDQLAFSSESDFAIFINQISSEIPLQRLVAVKRMIKSCHLWGEEAVLSVLPRVKQLSCDKEMVIRQAIAEVLGPFAKYLVETMSPHIYETIDDDNNNNNSKSTPTSTPSSKGKQQTGIERAHNVIITELLPLIKEMLKDAMEVRQGAGSSLIIIAELLNKEEVYEHILKIVLHMAHDDSDDQKITALPLLGDLAPIVGSAVCKNYLSADLHALSQDNSFRVRKATVQYFGPICEQLGNVDAEECLLPIFLSLCNDSIWSVRKGCVESFVDVSSSISSESRVKLIPIMENFLNDSSRWVRNTAYEILGPFISSLDSSQITSDFLKYFTSIPHLSSAEADADCTNHCAFNFPAVVLTVGKERWNELNDTYNILCRKTFKSRKTLACSIHEIASVLGKELTEKYLLNSIEFFLKDIDDIRQGIIKNLWKILKVFNEKLRIEYISILWELASESDVNWRFRLLLSQQLDEILYLYGKKIIKQQIIPLIFQLCQDRMADVRYAAVYPIADAINILMDPVKDTEDKPDTNTTTTSTTGDGNDGDEESKEKDNDDNNKNEENNDDDTEEGNLECITKKIQTIYKGRTYSKRLLYIRIADSCFNRIDTELFNKIFLNDLLNYANDKIFNVRFCLARFIDKNLYENEKYNDNQALLKAIEILKNDEEDVEIKRFFMTTGEIDEWVKFQKQERHKKESLQRQNQQQMNGGMNGGMGNDDDNKGNGQRSGHQQTKSKDSDLDSTDSSLYSSSDSDGNDDDIGDDEDGDDSDSDDDDGTTDKLKSVAAGLESINDNLTNNKLQDMDIKTIGTNELSEEMLKNQTDATNLDYMQQGLIHQDTPYKLNIPKELAEEDEEEQKKKEANNTGNYGLPVEPKEDDDTNEDQEQAKQSEELEQEEQDIVMKDDEENNNTENTDKDNTDNTENNTDDKEENVSIENMDNADTEQEKEKENADSNGNVENNEAEQASTTEDKE